MLKKRMLAKATGFGFVVRLLLVICLLGAVNSVFAQQNGTECPEYIEGDPNGAGQLTLHQHSYCDESGHAIPIRDTNDPNYQDSACYSDGGVDVGGTHGLSHSCPPCPANDPQWTPCPYDDPTCNDTTGYGGGGDGGHALILSRLWTFADWLTA